MVKNQKGFTLVEMMIVLLVISVLLMITVPNVTKHNSSINEKGEAAFIKMVEGQVQAYEMENHTIPTVQELIDNKFINSPNGPSGKTITIDGEGKVSFETAEGS